MMNVALSNEECRSVSVNRVLWQLGSAIVAARRWDWQAVAVVAIRQWLVFLVRR